MRLVPTDEDDTEELKRLNVEQWMVECLKLNPTYVHWGPGEDYMDTRGDSWQTSKEIDSWSEFGPWALDDLNEVVNFYFELSRDSEYCTACDKSGYNPRTKVIADTFYDHGDYSIDFENWKIVGSIENARKPGGATGRRWHDKITQDEVDALVAAGRLRKWADSGWQTVRRTAAEVNAANADGAKGCHDLNHDALNRGILIETRAKRLGVWGMCEACDGKGYVHTEPAGHLNIVLWFIHPRKGCSRGVRVKNLSEQDARSAKDYLTEAAKRNARRFAGVL